MGTLVVIIILLGGVSAFGFIGIILGPLVAAVVMAHLKVCARLLEEDAATDRGETPRTGAERAGAPARTEARDETAAQ